MAIIPQAPGRVFAQPASVFIDTLKGPILASEFKERRSFVAPAQAFTNYFGRVHKKYKKMDTTNIENLAYRLLQEKDPAFLIFVKEETLLRDTFLHRFFEVKTPLGKVLQELGNIIELPGRQLLSKEIFNKAEKEVIKLTKKEEALAVKKGGHQVANEISYLQKSQTTIEKIGPEFQVNTNIIGEQRVPSTACLSTGKFVVVWQDYQTGDDNVYGQVFNANGTKSGTEFQVNTYTADWQKSPSVASLSNGKFVVTWSSRYQDGDWEGIYGQIFNENRTKSGSEFQINTYTVSGQDLPSAASLSNGQFVVTWQSYRQDGSEGGIFGQMLNENGTKSGTEFQVNTYVISTQAAPSIASLSNDKFVVVWQSPQDGSGHGVYGQMFNENRTKSGTEFLVNTFTTSEQAYPSVANLSNGEFVVTWRSDGQDGNGDGVFGQIFNTDGTKSGSEFLANTYTTNNQLESSIARLSNDQFVITWTSWDQDGDGAGVYGQIFEAIILTSSTISSSTSSTTSSSTSSTTSSSTSSTTSSSISSSSPSSTRTSSSVSGRVLTFSNNATGPRSFSLLWGSLLGAGAFCLYLVGGITYILRRRKTHSDAETDRVENKLSLVSSEKFELEPMVKRAHKEIGGVYYQMSKISKEEAQEIYEQTGHMILFPESRERFKYMIGRGNFGAIKVAQRIENHEYVVSKKVKGVEEMKASEGEANMQREAAGANVLPIYNTIRFEEALYHFMPFAGYGSGGEIQSLLFTLNNPKLAIEILKFVTRDILTGLKTIHRERISHLDIKPENIVFTKDGIAYITDFGCAKKAKGRSTQISWEATGDNRYFSPERLKSGREQSTFDGEKEDTWAAGVTLLQIITNKDPFQLFEMPVSLLDRVRRCNKEYFREKLHKFDELQNPGEDSIWWVIKGLLNPESANRFTAQKALEASCFKGLNKTLQEMVFENLKKEKLTVHPAMEEERQHIYDSRQHQHFYAERNRDGETYQDVKLGKQEKMSSSANRGDTSEYKFTPDKVTPLYKFTPDKVTPLYKFIPDEVKQV
ncbi:MAG: Serine/threonine-protein kinase PknH [Candidatus Anoxychlamydiales bacterium]|nr:Serine/threonine-protein kinase PknH [Candidatus Anoxychlamydiales bacterium]